MPPPPSSQRIAEIHGLRGLALALVVVFHLFGNGRVSGGVDVFLALTGFLVTRSLVRRVAASELRLADHYGRTFLRLSAPTLVVLAGTAGLMVAVMPRAIWGSTLREIAASVTYVLNWEMIRSQLAYGAAGPSASPLQHFWSLAVQGQFLLVWPMVLMGVWWVARARLRVALAVVVALATVTSFVFAWRLGMADQQVAYFHTGARFWELGVGALLALGLDRLRPPGAARPVLAWVGLLLVASSGFVLDGAALFPGPWALWPVGGALLVVIGSGSAVRWGPQRLLAVRPLRFVADISFPLYLWHWPLLVAWLSWTYATRTTLLAAVVVLSASVVLAWLTHRYVEVPVTRLGPHSSGVGRLVAIPVVLSLVAGTTIAGAIVVERQDTAARAAAVAAAKTYAGCIGAAALDPATAGCEGPDRLLDASLGYQAPDGSSCWSNKERPVRFKVCTLGPSKGYSRRLLAIGDSHNHQLVPAYREIAERRGWRIDVASRAGCHWNARDRVGAPATTVELCREWKSRLATYLTEEQGIDAYLVIHSSQISVESRGDERPGEALSRGLAEAWASRPDPSVPVIAIQDSPIFEGSTTRFARVVQPCVDDAGLAARSACARDRDRVVRDDGSAGAVRLTSNAHRVDLTDYFCEPDTCSPVVGNLEVYQDGFHVSPLYAATLAPYLGDRIATILS
ncbi:Peptidoglycan/LPS O-acetylase OafA/YrhL, contains acyltransferase and SGNH-hydrolase domains [Nocardioides sp. YR527]|uniref:acyltransferase family protein n=1 Tax=Nocardioides sp. YR527 TaxID=1881028 RepID=UPI000882D967|nr:acyltransferase family protein [Nocardioides sp. YR527]SDK23383.1 Peptidoglycan/LPS O-acetylase OafA/YrhL, contains acyltransferase and SGNH-hydrolase domains [Nocardioides sp. YR527]